MDYTILNLRFEIRDWRMTDDQEFIDGTSPRIYPWNQSQIDFRKSSSPRLYPWGQSKI